jgi:hypothetical protein
MAVETGEGSFCPDLGDSNRLEDFGDSRSGGPGHNLDGEQWMAGALQFMAEPVKGFRHG